MFLGTDGFEAQLAGASDISIVSINSSTYKNNTGPYFGNKNKQIIFESYLRTGNKKPSFNVNEIPKSINLIKPEEISNAIFKLLDIKFKMPVETVFVGEKYSHFTVQESIPDCKTPTFNPDNLVEIRADKEFTEENLAHQLNYFKKAIIVTDKPLNLAILKNFKPHIEGVVYKITKDNKNIEFLNNVRELGIKLILITNMPQKDVDAIKIDYYEIGAINQYKKYPEELINNLKKDLEQLYYRSSKIIASNGKVFYSQAAVEKDIILQNNFEYAKVIDTPSFWEGMDFYTIVKLTS